MSSSSDAEHEGPSPPAPAEYNKQGVSRQINGTIQKCLKLVANHPYVDGLLILQGQARGKVHIMHLGDHWRLIPRHTAVGPVDIIKRLLNRSTFARTVDELTRFPNFEEMATAVLEKGQAKEGVTQEQLASTMRDACKGMYQGKHDAHGSDVSVVNFPLSNGAPIGFGVVNKEVVQQVERFTKVMGDQSRQQAHPVSAEVLQKVTTQGYAAALSAAMEDGYRRGLRAAGSHEGGRQPPTGGPCAEVHTQSQGRTSGDRAPNPPTQRPRQFTGFLGGFLNSSAAVRQAEQAQGGENTAQALLTAASTSMEAPAVQAAFQIILQTQPHVEDNNSQPREAIPPTQCEPAACALD
uniref:Uncharacterized protein n=1 Tax=Dunaliella tertiolecta TaxID=3047 RepID=A0A7S3VJ97_DUNTE